VTTAETIAYIADASSWDERVTRLRQVPQRHGTNEHPTIYAEVARQVYVPHLAPDFAYVHGADFYGGCPARCGISVTAPLADDDRTAQL